MLLLELLLQISPDGIAARDEKTFRFARSRNIPIVMLTSGSITSKNVLALWSIRFHVFVWVYACMSSCLHARVHMCNCATNIEGNCSFLLEPPSYSHVVLCTLINFVSWSVRPLDEISFFKTLLGKWFYKNICIKSTSSLTVFGWLNN